MKTLIIALLIASPVAAADFRAAPEYQSDFDNAMRCHEKIAGRLVWKGEKAYYIQANEFYTDETGQESEDSVTTIFLDNSAKALKPFRLACR